MEEILFQRMESLLDYLGEVIKLGRKVTRNVKSHDDFLLFQYDLPIAEGISNFTLSEGNLSWLTIHQQRMSPQPPLPDILENWVKVYEDPSKKPEIVETREILNSHSEEQNPQQANFYDDKRRPEAFLEYNESWEKWSQDAIVKKQIQNLYRQFFRIKELIKYNEQLELIWGHGLLQWKTSGYDIEYPIITCRMHIEHNVEEGIIHVLPPDDAEPKLEFDALTDIEIPDLSHMKKIFEDSEYDPSDPESYTNFLKSISRTISPDGQFLESFNSISDFRQDIPKIIDCWVIFVRKRLEDAVKKDIDNFKNSLVNREKEGTPFPSGLKPFFENPKDKPKEYSSLKERNEWSAFLDKETLFPLQANNEQIQILDRIERANGIVVQGPPGTGKSHTIVNLICHFMAKGKRVLVTSQKDQALAVLHGMIPDLLKPLCLSVLTYDPDTRKKLEVAVGMITEIVNSNYLSKLKKEINELNEMIDNHKGRMAELENRMKDLAGAQFRKVSVDKDSADSAMLPSDLAVKLKEDSTKHEWLKDTPPYEIKRKVINRIGLVSISINPPEEQDMDIAVKLREKLLPYFDDFNFNLPDCSRLINSSKLRIIFKNLRKREYLQYKIDETLSGLFFKEEGQKKITKAILILKKGITEYKKIKDPWQKSILLKIRSKDPEIDNIQVAKNKLINRAKEIQRIWKSQDPLKSVDLGDTNDLEKLYIFVNEAEERSIKDKKAFAIFDKKEKKDALKKIKINDKSPESEKDWYVVKKYLYLLLRSNEVKAQWNALAQRVNGPSLKSIASIDRVKDLLKVIEKLYSPFRYKNDLFPKIYNALNEIIVEPQKFLREDLIIKLYNGLLLKREQLTFQFSVKALTSLKDYLNQFQRKDKPHPKAILLTKLLESFNTKNSEDEDEKLIMNWDEAFQSLQYLESILDDFKEFNAIIEKLAISTPIWAKRWYDKTEKIEDLYPSDCLESWLHKALYGYLEDISNEAQKISHLKGEQEKFERLLRQDKEKLSFTRTKLGLILNTTDICMQSLKGWLLAVKKLGKGTGKWAWKRQKDVQHEMEQAQGAVPVWIMPLYRVSQTLPSKFRNFDVAIIDEASQCNEFAFPALMRSKKVIVVGDPEQISPVSVGIPDQEIDKLKNEYLKDIPGYHRYGLTTSLYALADVAFGSQNALMLREHFRCVPEIIKFSNNLCYHGKILPLRNPPLEQRLNPPIHPIFVEEGYREVRQNVNKPEAKRICEKIKELVNDRRYRGKTFGVISLVGNDQAKYIHTLIDDYLSPEEIERHQFHVGDAYAFQGDERDIMFLSMVVSGVDDIALRASVGDVFKQRFNVAASRAKDQMFLFHSVRLGVDLKNPADLKYQLLNFFQSGIPPSEKEKKPIDLFESPFEEAVYNWLVSRRYIVTPQVKVGEYRIDLVVEGRNNRLAVECNGDRYHTPDRWWEDSIRQRQLERAGWKFWIVWGSTFYKDPDSAMASIIPVLEELDIQPIDFQDASQKSSQDYSEEKVQEETNSKSQYQREDREDKKKRDPKQQTLFENKIKPQTKEDIVTEKRGKAKAKKIRIVKSSKTGAPKIAQIKPSSLVDPLPHILSHLLSDNEKKCDECGSETQILIGRNGPFLKCTNFKCKKAKSIEKRLLDNAFKILHIPCNRCGMPMKVAWGPKGPFPGCSKYPDCNNAEPWKDLRERLKQKQVRQKLGST